MDQAQGTVAEQIGQKLSVSVQDEGRDVVRGLDQLRGPSGRPWRHRLKCASVEYPGTEVVQRDPHPER
jgi:hypothetical protein